MAQVVYRRADVGPACFSDQCIRIVSELGPQKSLDRRAHPVDDRSQVVRLILRRCPQFFECRQNRAALRVAKDDDESRGVSCRGEFDAADLGGSDDVAGDANDEQIAEPLIEDVLDRRARIGAAEDDGERSLPLDEMRMPAAARAAFAGDEARVALAQASEAIFGRDRIGSECTGHDRTL